MLPLKREHSVEVIQKEDVSQYVIHLTRQHEKGLSPFETLVKILKDRALLGGTGHIMEGKTAICFTESTLDALNKVFKSGQARHRYRPFGIMIAKYLAFGWDALPVIYQPKADYCLLDTSKRFLHVTYQLNSSDNADFTWEREWRMPRDRLPLTRGLVHVLVPTHAVKDRVLSLLTEEENPPEDPWRLVVLEDLDPKVETELASGEIG